MTDFGSGKRTIFAFLHIESSELTYSSFDWKINHKAVLIDSFVGSKLIIKM